MNQTEGNRHRARSVLLPIIADRGTCMDISMQAVEALGNIEKMADQHEAEMLHLSGPSIATGAESRNKVEQ